MKVQFACLVFLVLMCSCTNKKKQQYFHKNGNLSSEGFLIDDQKEGEWRGYYDDGKIRSIDSFKFGRLHGINKVFFDYREIQENKLHKLILGSKSFDEEHRAYLRRVTPYEHGRENGKAFVYFQNGEWREEMYEQGELIDYFKTYYKNGTLAIHALIEDEKIISYKEFHDTGELSAEGKHNVDNQRHGLWQGYYKSGELYWTGMKENGMKVGTYEYFFRNGKQKGYFKYVKNRSDGESKFYWPNGKLKSHSISDMGKDISKREYYESGKLKSELLFEEGRLISKKEF